MSKSKTVDLTSGPILKTLAELALPIMISSMLGTAYSIMDMAWIGLLGAKAVAGVGVGGMYVWLSQGLASLSRMGGQVNTARHVGAKIMTRHVPMLPVLCSSLHCPAFCLLLSVLFSYSLCWDFLI